MVRNVYKIGNFNEKNKTWQSYFGKLSFDMILHYDENLFLIGLQRNTDKIIYWEINFYNFALTSNNLKGNKILLAMAFKTIASQQSLIAYLQYNN